MNFESEEEYEDWIYQDELGVEEVQKNELKWLLEEIQWRIDNIHMEYVPSYLVEGNYWLPDENDAEVILYKIKEAEELQEKLYIQEYSNILKEWKNKVEMKAAIT